MSDNKITQYSIWWVPNEPWLSQLQVVVDDLAKEFGAEKYGAATFVPHVTVVPDIQIGEGGFASVEQLIQKVGELAKVLKPLEFNFAEVAVGESFFQCVYVKALLHKQMLSQVKTAREMFRPEMVGTDFLPHMSVLYGDHDVEIRELAAAKARELITLPIEDKISKISLWTSGVPASEWEMVAEFGVGK